MLFYFEQEVRRVRHDSDSSDDESKKPKAIRKMKIVTSDNEGSDSDVDVPRRKPVQSTNFFLRIFQSLAIFIFSTIMFEDMTPIVMWKFQEEEKNEMIVIVTVVMTVINCISTCNSGSTCKHVIMILIMIVLHIYTYIYTLSSNSHSHPHSHSHCGAPV